MEAKSNELLALSVGVVVLGNVSGFGIFIFVIVKNYYQPEELKYERAIWILVRQSINVMNYANFFFDDTQKLI